MAAAATAASLRFFSSSSLVANPSLIYCGSLQRRIPLIRSCATATKQTEFNVSFAVPYKKEALVKGLPPPGLTSQLLVPWVVRSGNGNISSSRSLPLPSSMPFSTRKQRRRRITGIRRWQLCRPTKCPHFLLQSPSIPMPLGGSTTRTSGRRSDSARSSPLLELNLIDPMRTFA